MPVHDWTKVDAGIFHDFHNVWIGLLRNALNEGLLPDGYYALSEQHAGKYITDVLTLHSETKAAESLPIPVPGGVAVAEAPAMPRALICFSMGQKRRHATRYTSFLRVKRCGQNISCLHPTLRKAKCTVNIVC